MNERNWPSPGGQVLSPVFAPHEPYETTATKQHGGNRPLQQHGENKGSSRD